jgi:predicted AAA+ superfamily ATPase
MKIHRAIEKKVQLYSNQFRAIALMGIRQSGKTTLSKMLFPGIKYGYSKREA